MKKLALIYTLFVCYAPATYLILPNIYGDISIVWVMFFIGVIWFYPKAVMDANLSVANPWIFCLGFLSLLYFASIFWTDGYSYDLITFQRLFARRLVPLLVAIMALSLFVQQVNAVRFIKHFLIVCCFLSIYAGYQKFFGESLAKDERAAATFHNPNALALFLMMAVPSTLYLLETKQIKRYIGLVVIAIIIVGIILTGSRKGVATTALSVILYFLLNRQFKKVLFSLVAASIILIIALTTSDTVSKRFNLEDLDERAHVAGTAFNMFLDKPIVGWGFNGFRDQYAKFFPLSQKDSFTSHNTYATILANYGMLGFIPFIGIFLIPIWTARKVLKRWRYRANDHQKGVAALTISTTIPFMIAIYFTGGNFQMYYMNMILFTLMSFHLAQYKALEKEIKASK